MSGIHEVSEVNTEQTGLGEISDMGGGGDFDNIEGEDGEFEFSEDLFKCRASLLYPIFVNQWSGTVNDDKLLIGSVNTCVAVRPFSVYGLPYSK